jgi:hypothetical protein
MNAPSGNRKNSHIKYDYYEFGANGFLLQHLATRAEPGTSRETELKMFVQIALRNGESAQVCNRVVEIVQIAIREALGIDAALVHLTLGSNDSKGVPPCRRDEVRVAILIVAPEKFGPAKKRRLFGRIAEISGHELEIAHDQIVTGIIETPRENWSNGYGERQWLQYLAYQLP